MNACVHLPQSNVKAVCFNHQTNNRKAQDMDLKNKNIYNSSGCVHQQIPKPHDETHQPTKCYNFPLQVSSEQQLVRSSIIHIPKTPDTKTQLLNLTHPLAISASSVHLFVLFKTHLQGTQGFNNQFYNYIFKRIQNHGFLLL